MECRKSMWISGILLLGLAVGGKASNGVGSNCNFPAIYNFGDSNSDTGGNSAALSVAVPPNGMTFFGKPSGRYCDGRLIIDFISEELGLPYLSAYLDAIGTNFRHGANFAASGSSILRGGYSPFDLDQQISQFLQFKSRSTELYKQLSVNRTMLPLRSILARPKDFSKALYTFDIGQNDIYNGLNHTSEANVIASIPSLLDRFNQAVKQLYKEGAQFFWVHNTGPVGCLPYSVIYNHPKPENLDHNGCIKSQNEVAQEFNRQLKGSVSKLKAVLPHSIFTYVDVYSTKYTLISHAKRYGFEDSQKFCCGSFYGHHVECGAKETVNGTVYGNVCDNPSRLISWDGIHYSEAANLLVSRPILNGSLSQPPNSILEACCQNHRSQ